MAMYALNRRLASLSDRKVTVVSFDPGMMPGTGIAREAGPFVRFLWFHLMPRLMPLLRRLVNPNTHTPQESGSNLAWLSTSPELEGISGAYYEVRKEIKSSKDSYNEEKQEDIWAWTIKNVASSEEEMRRFDIGK
jgi:hypothetical protein